MKLIISVLCSLLLGFCEGDDLADYTGSGPEIILEGKPLFVTCRVVEFDHIKWHVNGRPVTPGVGVDADVSVTEATVAGYLVSNLTVPVAQYAHSGHYRCTSFVDNEHVVQVVSADMIKTNADDTNGLLVLAGTDDLKLECTATPVQGTVKWTKSLEGSVPEFVKTNDRVVVDEGKLTITKPTELDAGNYTCNVHVPGDISNLNATIQVVTNVTVRMSGKSINKQEEEDLTVTCRAYGKPTPAVRWTKSGDDVSNIFNSTSRLSLGPNDDGVPMAQLVLKTLVRPDDSGDYCCHAENVANAASDCIIIRVKDKYAALWPFIGIVAEVIILTTIIYIYEKKKSKPDMDDSDTDHANDRPTESKGDVHRRK